MKNREVTMKRNCGSRTRRVALRTRWLRATTDWTEAESNRRRLLGPVGRELITDEECGQLLVTNLVCEPISSRLDADGSRWRIR